MRSRRVLSEAMRGVRLPLKRDRFDDKKERGFERDEKPREKASRQISQTNYRREKRTISARRKKFRDRRRSPRSDDKVGFNRLSPRGL